MNKSIELMDTREKLIYLRRTLKTTQRALAGDTLTKEFISMVEGGKRNMSREVAIMVMKNALNLANEKGIDIGLDEEYLTRSKEDDLCEICNRLDNTIVNMEIFNKIIEYAEENNYPWTEIMATKKIGNALFVNREFNKAYSVYLSCLSMIDRMNSNKYKEHIYTCIGNIKAEMTQYDEALIYYEEALNYCYKSNKLTVKNNIMYNIALILNNSGNYYESLKRIEEVLGENLPSELKTKFEVLKACNYKDLNLIDEALNMYEGILKDKETNEKFKSIIYSNMAGCYVNKGQYEKFSEYFDLAIKTDMSRPKEDYKFFMNKIEMNRKLGRYREAKKLIFQGMKLSEVIDDYKYKLRYLDELYLVEEREKKIEGMKKALYEILNICKTMNLNEKSIWARKKLIDIAIKENDLSILKEA